MRSGENFKLSLVTSTACALAAGSFFLGATSARAQTAVPASTSAAAHASTPPPAAAGQPNASGQAVPTQLNEVVVTAERRESTAQRTAAAITVISPQTLARQHIVDVTSLNTVLTNTQIYAIQNNVQISIRGVGSTFVDPRADPAVAASVNGLFLDRPLPANFALLDVARVEALNGPQGTLYGRNAAAGALNIVSNQPSNRFEGNASVSGGNLGTNDVSGVLNVPVGDNFALRGAYERDRSNGFIDNYFDDVHTEAARVAALWTPLPKLRILAEWDYAHQGGNGATQIPYPCPGSKPYDLFIPGNCSYLSHQPYQIPKIGNVNSSTNAYQVHLDYDLGFATLTSITGYVITRNFEDSQNGAIFGDADPNLSGGTIISASNDFTEEFRISGNGNANHAGGVTWVAGLFIFHSLGDFQFLIPSLGGGQNYPDLPQRSEAGFGQVTYGLTDKLRLTGGLRYTHDYKGLEYQGFPTFTHTNDYRVTYKAGAEYQLARANLLYANVSTGYVSGGPNGGANLPNPPPFTGSDTFLPESVTAYEVGSKNRFLANRLELNGDFYYDDFKNYQLYLPGTLSGDSQPANVIQNVPKVTTYGLELSGAYAATPDDQFNASLTLAHGEFSNANLVTFTFGPTGVAGLPYQVTDGSRLLNLPRWQSNLGYQHTFHLGDSSSLIFLVATKLSGNYLTTITQNGTPVPADIQPSYTRTDLSVTYTPPGDRFSIRLWGKNLEDSYVNLYGEGAGYYLYSVLPPRTYGVTFSAKF